MTDIEALIAEWREASEGVTPGPWYQTGAPWFSRGDGVVAGSPDGNIAPLIIDCDTSSDRDEYSGPFELGDPERDAAWLARCSPLGISALLDTIEALKAERDAANDRMVAAVADYNDAREQLARAREALEPFARAAERISTAHLDGHAGDDDELPVKVGHLRAARRIAQETTHG